MNSLSVPRIHYHFTIFFANSLSFSWNHYEVTINLANILWIYYQFSEFTLNSLSLPRIHYHFTIFFANSLSFSWNHYEVTINLANSLWIYYQFSEFTLNSLSVSRIHFQFTIYFTNSLYIHYHFREFTICSANSLSFSRILPQVIICHVNNDPRWPILIHGESWRLLISYGKLSFKLGCVVRMVVDSILPHAECGPNDHQKDALPFILWLIKRFIHLLRNHFGMIT